MKHLLKTSFYLLLFVASTPVMAQNETEIDSSTVHEAEYSRPFINNANTGSVAVGGYLEGNTNYFSEEGISEGFSMEMRRFNIFLYSTIIPRVRMLAELEFEHGTEEIALEAAQIDVEFSPTLNLRAGILVVPIGGYNQNHDSPRWEFVERPLVATQIIPSTLSEIGFGLNGKFIAGKMLFTYDAYVVNGLSDGVVVNAEGRTFLAAGKTEERLAEDNNGRPAYTGRLGSKLLSRGNLGGELGLSFYTGAYNTNALEGEEVSDLYNLSIMAVDFSTKIFEADFKGEFAFVNVETPAEIAEIYGNKQWGGFLEVLYPIVQRSLFGFENASINLAVRAEKIDYNVGTFELTGDNIFDEIQALSFGLSFRPSANTVFRANYINRWTRDVLGNPAGYSAGVQVGVATYF